MVVPSERVAGWGMGGGVERELERKGGKGKDLRIFASTTAHGDLQH